MISKLSAAGVKSEYAYIAGFASIGLTVLSWATNRAKSGSKEQADRWGLFVGEWTPTFFAIGIALRQEELANNRR